MFTDVQIIHYVCKAKRISIIGDKHIDETKYYAGYYVWVTNNEFYFKHKIWLKSDYSRLIY